MGRGEFRNPPLNNDRPTSTVVGWKSSTNLHSPAGNVGFGVGCDVGFEVGFEVGFGADTGAPAHSSRTELMLSLPVEGQLYDPLA